MAASLAGVLDGSEDLADGDSVFRAPLRMGQYDGSVSVEDEITPELPPVLTAPEIGDSSLQQ